MGSLLNSGTKIASEILNNNDAGFRYQEYNKRIKMTFEFQPIISRQVFLLLKKLNKSKGAGLDMISNRLIRDCADLISPQVFLKSLVTVWQYIS